MREHPVVIDNQRFIAGLSFRYIQPQTPIPRYLRSLLRNLDAIGLSFEFINTRVPPEAQVLKTRIKRIFTVRKMSSLAIGMMINQIVSTLSADTCFVNIGVWKGFTLFAGMVGNAHQTCIGVDRFLQEKSPKDAFMKRFLALRSPHHHFYEMDCATYFQTVHTGNIGFYLYDGDHRYDCQMENLLMAEPFFADRCVILIDDINYHEARQAAFDFMRQSRYGYEIVVDERTRSNKHLTFWNGVMLLQRVR